MYTQEWGVFLEIVLNVYLPALAFFRRLKQIIRHIISTMLTTAVTLPYTSSEE